MRSQTALHFLHPRMAKLQQHKASLYIISQAGTKYTGESSLLHQQKLCTTGVRFFNSNI